jgi:hypothetical protein
MKHAKQVIIASEKFENEIREFITNEYGHSVKIITLGDIS